MPTFPAPVNRDANNIATTATYDDRGDGTDDWFQPTRVFDGGDVAQGDTGDAAVTDPTATASIVALLKGILTRLGGTAVSNATTAALDDAAVIKASPGRLYGVTGYSTTAQFLQFHNTTSIPSNGAAPVVVIPIEANKPFSIDFGLLGRPFSTGITICNSTTGPTKTLGGTDTWWDVQYV